MGNTVSPCLKLQKSSSSSSTKLIFWEGTTKILEGKHVAGEIMFEFPEKMVCHADSFFIGRPIPALAIDDRLKPGQTYFVLPIDLLSCTVFSAASLSTLVSSSPNSINNKKNDSSRPSPSANSPIRLNDFRPFEYIKASNGTVLIKVAPEFITRLIYRGKNVDDGGNSNNNKCSENESKSFLCSTPELKKHYDQLVGPKEQVWSPKLDTISEYKIRFSPCRYLGLEWVEKEKIKKDK